MTPRPQLTEIGVLCCALLLAVGCFPAYLNGQVPALVIADAPDGTPPLRVGTASADITPIPGIPIGGVGPKGKMARGFWTRLQARALYIEGPDHAGSSQVRPLALVATDLMITPNALPERVAEILAKDKGLGTIGLENLVIAATETHQGPGNYLSDKLHNAFDSPRDGFDPELFEFLAQRIAQAIETAHSNAKAAQLRLSAPTSATPLEILRNRSLPAFLLNPEAVEYLEPDPMDAMKSKRFGLEACATPSAAYPDPRACQAVDPRVGVLRFAEKADPDKTIAVAVFLATHSVVLSSYTEVFSGDLFAVAAQLLERGGSGVTCRVPFAVLFNGAQGDVSVAWEHRDRAELLHLAKDLANHVCDRLGELEPEPVSPYVAFQRQVVELGWDPPDGEVKDPEDRPPSFERRTTKQPRPGATQISGAEEARTIFHELGHGEGLRRFVRDEHGRKSAPGQIDLGGMHWNPLKTAMKMAKPEKWVPVGVYAVGDAILVGLPGEFTTVMGERIRKEVLKKLPVTDADPDPRQVFLIGFANGHSTYVTTPEEYDAQHYEGASSFYGPATGPLLEMGLAQLAGKLRDPVSSEIHDPFSYAPGNRNVFKPRDLGLEPHFVDDGLANIVTGTGSSSHLHLPERRFPTFCWLDAVPRLAPVTNAPACQSSQPLVKILDVSAGAPLQVGGIAQDNRGLDLVTVAMNVGETQMEWCAVWMVPDGAEGSKSYRFEVAKLEGGVEMSTPFQLDQHYQPPPAPNAPDPFVVRAGASPQLPDTRSEWSLWCWPGIDELFGRCSGTCSVQP